MGKILVFISHSSTDREVAKALTDLLEGALGLSPAQIRCTSVDGHRLPGGADTNEQLRLEIMEATSFVGIISQPSIRSVYVLFELGARWGTSLNMIPVLAPGTDHSLLKGPLSGLNALELGQRQQVQQLVSDLARQLELETSRPEAYDNYIDRLVESASASSDAQPADVAQVTMANEYDDNDIISILEGWLEEKAEDLFNVHYAKLDGELGLPPGSTKRLIRTASQRYFEVVREGQSNIRLQAKQFDPGYVEDDWDGYGTI